MSFFINMFTITCPKSTLKKRKFAESSACSIASNCSLPSYSVWPPKSLIGRKKQFFPQFFVIFYQYLHYYLPKINSKKKKIRRIFCLFDCKQLQPLNIFCVAARATERRPQKIFLLILRHFPAISPLLLSKINSSNRKCAENSACSIMINHSLCILWLMSFTRDSKKLNGSERSTTISKTSFYICTDELWWV